MAETTEVPMIKLEGQLEVIRNLKPTFSTDEIKVFRKASVQTDRYRLAIRAVRMQLKRKRMSAQFLGFSGQDSEDGEDSTLVFKVEGRVFEVTRDGPKSRARELEMVQNSLQPSSGHKKVLELFKVHASTELTTWEAIANDKAARRKVLRKLKLAKVQVENQGPREMLLEIRNKK
ncbi:MAG: hypothetical protein HETSPECPRED_005377 [Heterodermia speciosa]|uniref:Uncharacterized protein n=1 Tax=Heterodermia speciosa TaxID=116794 RepID=A0A8H3FFD9_9LECA|nr:MAG: hypothetical protein HETSPECPRED_005377 [Heterodermia speciosa]